MKIHFTYHKALPANNIGQGHQQVEALMELLPLCSSESSQLHFAVSEAQGTKNADSGSQAIFSNTHITVQTLRKTEWNTKKAWKIKI